VEVMEVGETEDCAHELRRKQRKRAVCVVCEYVCVSFESLVPIPPTRLSSFPPVSDPRLISSYQTTVLCTHIDISHPSRMPSSSLNHLIITHPVSSLTLQH